MPATLETLPVDVLMVIISLLSASSIRALRASCRSLRSAINSSQAICALLSDDLMLSPLYDAMRFFHKFSISQTREDIEYVAHRVSRPFLWFAFWKECLRLGSAQYISVGLDILPSFPALFAFTTSQAIGLCNDVRDACFLFITLVTFVLVC